MKYLSIAVLALLGQASAINYSSSEGSTKADYGEHDDEATVIREDRDKNGWVNPLSLTDDGDDDGVVLTMVDGSLVRALGTQFVQNKHRGHHRHISDALTMIDGTMRPIYDEDGDGVEDNVKLTHD